MGAQSNSTASLSESEQRDVARSMNAVRSVVRALRINTRAIELKMGISLAQLFVLQQLDAKPAESLNELAERTATHQSSVSVVVRRLVQAGLVSRTAAPHDRRRVHIALTPEGRTRLAGAPQTVQVQMLAGLERMSADQRRTLADLLEQWLTSSGIDVAAPPMMFEDDGDNQG
jgi:DNA-binding MarR family transcriptional regulator